MPGLGARPLDEQLDRPFGARQQTRLGQRRVEAVQRRLILARPPEGLGQHLGGKRTVVRVHGVIGQVAGQQTGLDGLVVAVQRRGRRAGQYPGVHEIAVRITRLQQGHGTPGRFQHVEVGGLELLATCPVQPATRLGPDIVASTGPRDHLQGLQTAVADCTGAPEGAAGRVKFVQARQVDHVFPIIHLVGAMNIALARASTPLPAT